MSDCSTHGHRFYYSDTCERCGQGRASVDAESLTEEVAALRERLDAMETKIEQILHLLRTKL